MNRFVMVTGLGIGEEAKSSSVEKLVQLLDAHTVYRHGGCQAAHHLVRSDGIEVSLSQFGCGVLDGADTILHHMTIEPFRLFREVNLLKEVGVSNPQDRISIHESCLVVTPFHGALSRIKERCRTEKKGTIGMGVGDAVYDSRLSEDWAIYVSDLFLPQEQLRSKLDQIRIRKLSQAQQVLRTSGHVEVPAEIHSDYFEELSSESLVDTTLQVFLYLTKFFEIIDDQGLNRFLNKPGAIVSEPSHGALLHPNYGFVPHVTQIDPTSTGVVDTLCRQAYDGEVLHFGVVRAYMTRQGHGPLVSSSECLRTRIPENHNADGEDWLGQFRSGSFDLVALRYALEVCGGPNAFNGLILNHLDVLNEFSEWPVCVAYRYTGTTDIDLSEFFEIRDDLIVSMKVPNLADQDQVERQKVLTQLLWDCEPVEILLSAGTKSLETTFLEFAERQLQVPVVMTSHGPTSDDRTLTPLGESLFSLH